MYLFGSHILRQKGTWSLQCRQRVYRTKNAANSLFVLMTTCFCAGPRQCGHTGGNCTLWVLSFTRAPGIVSDIRPLTLQKAPESYDRCNHRGYRSNNCPVERVTINAKQ